MMLGLGLSLPSIGVLNAVGRVTPITILGAKLLAWWSADRSDLVVTVGGTQVSSWKDIVGGYDLIQSVSGARPIYSENGFNGAPAIVFDGVDDELSITPAPASFPTGATPGEMLAVCSNEALPDDTTVRYAVGQGNGITTGRRLRRQVVTGVNRGGTSTGLGGSSVTLPDVNVDLSGRHVIKGIFGATTSNVQVDGSINTPAAAVPNTFSTRFRAGAADSAVAANFWNGMVRDILVYLPPTAQETLALDAWAQRHRDGSDLGSGSGSDASLAPPIGPTSLVESCYSWHGQGPFMGGFMGGSNSITRKLMYVFLTNEDGDQYIAEVEAATGRVVATKAITTGLYLQDDHLGTSAAYAFHNDAGKLIVLCVGHASSSTIDGSADKVIRHFVSDTGRVADLVQRTDISNTFQNLNYMQGWKNGNTVLALTNDDNTRTWAAIRSQNGGESFADRATIIRQANDPGGGQNQIYLKSALWSANRVLCLAWSHTSNSPNYLCPFEIEITTGNVYTKDAVGVETLMGEVYSTANRTELFDISTLAAIETTPEGKTIRLLDVRRDGRAYLTGEAGAAPYTDGEYFYHALTGDNPYDPAAWSKVSLGPIGAPIWSSYYPGACFGNEPHTGERVYRIKEVSGTYTLDRLDSVDGVTFTATQIDQSSTHILARPISPTGATADLPVLYQKLTSYIDFHRWEGDVVWPLAA